MQVFIAGSTGVLGRRLVTGFVDQGHTVVGLTRDDDGDDIVEARGGEPRRGDLFDEQSVVQAAEGADIVVHAATAIPTEQPTRNAWELNDRVRREGTRALTKATAEVGADRYLQQSIVWVARQPDGSPFDEDSSLHPGPTTQSAVDAEEIAREDGERHGFDVGILRCGQFYAPDAFHTRAHGRALVDGNRPIVDGSDAALLSQLHVDDAASAFVTAAEADQLGLWHVVDNEPVSAATFSTALAERLDAPTPDRVPESVARQKMGDGLVELLTSPMPTANDRFRETFGWEPEYPTYEEGLDHVVETWKANAFLV